MKPLPWKLFALIACVAIASQLIVAYVPTQHSHPHEAPHPSTLNPGEPAPEIHPSVYQQTDSKQKKIDPLLFRQAVRKLWEDHVTWTRVYIIAALAGSPEADAAAQRLLQNQADIGNAIKPFYGDQAGEQLTSLLRDHILIAADLLSAAKSGDTAGFEEANVRWYDNADQIAAFLSSANSDNWPLSDMQAMMKSHLDLTLEEAVARLNGDWAGDVLAYDQVHDEILQMAGMLTEGIVRQFRNKFK